MKEDVNVKPNLLITIVSVAIIAFMTIITACIEKDVIEDVVGTPIETAPETTPEEPEMTTEVSPPPAVTVPEMTAEVTLPVEDTTPGMTPDPVETEPEPTIVEITPEPDPLAPGEGLAIGATAPEFSLPDADGNIVSLSDYVGQKLVIAFYATST
jgi:hypothetical protein